MSAQCRGLRVEAKNGAVPDHGDFWQLPWQVEMYGDSRLRQSAIGFSRRLRMTKELSVTGRCLRMGYTISNVGDSPNPFLYACHALLAVDEGDIILLPDEVTSVSVNYSRDERVARPGDRVPWPQVSTSNRDLSIVLPYKAHSAEMLYTKRLARGWAAVYRATAR